MGEDIEMSHFKEKLFIALIGDKDINRSIYPLNEKDLNNIIVLQKEKYQTWKWNYGESPTSFNIKEKRYPGGKIEIHFDLNQGKLKQVKLFGDFLDTGDRSIIENTLEDCMFQLNAVKNVLKDIKIDDYIFNITNNNLISCLFE